MSPSPRQQHDGLFDGRGRAITYLRLSVTERCNLHCAYCRPLGVAAAPAREPEPAGRPGALDEDEVVRLAGLLARHGIRKIRLTGGEPLLRPRLPELCARLARLPGIETLGLTTNGVRLAPLLAPLRAAGVTRLNVSLDTLDRERYARLTGSDRLGEVLAALEAAAAAGFPAPRLNCVLQRGVNDEALGDLVAFAADRGMAIRFIEAMPLGAGDWDRRAFFPAEEARRRLARRFELLPIPAGGEGGEPRGPATEWTVAGTGTVVGFIAAATGGFCARCNRLRLLADGRLKPCLYAPGSVALGALARAGADDATLLAAIREALDRKRNATRPGSRAARSSAAGRAPCLPRDTIARIGG